MMMCVLPVHYGLSVGHSAYFVIAAAANRGNAPGSSQTGVALGKALASVSPRSTL